jgi:hypothetical protein
MYRPLCSVISFIHRILISGADLPRTNNRSAYFRRYSQDFSPSCRSLCAQYPLIYSPPGLTGARRDLPRISVEVRRCSEGESQWATDPSTGETKLSVRNYRFLPIRSLRSPNLHTVPGDTSPACARDKAPTDVPFPAGAGFSLARRTQPGSPARVGLILQGHSRPVKNKQEKSNHHVSKIFRTRPGRAEKGPCSVEISPTTTIHK